MVCYDFFKLMVDPNPTFNLFLLLCFLYLYKAYSTLPDILGCFPFDYKPFNL